MEELGRRTYPVDNDPVASRRLMAAIMRRAADDLAALLNNEDIPDVTQHKLTPEERRGLLHQTLDWFFLDGNQLVVTFEDTCQATGMRPAVVRDWIRTIANGSVSVKIRRRKLTQKQTKAILAAFRSGLSSTEIGRRFGLHAASARKVRLRARAAGARGLVVRSQNYRHRQGM
jgi:hypothetical protein